MSNRLKADEAAIANMQANQNINPTIVPTLARAQDDINQLASLSKLLLDYSDMLEVIRRELRGEEYLSVKAIDGTVSELLVQTTKPIFIKLNMKTREPLKRAGQLLDTNGKRKLEYIPHEDAIEELITTLRLGGINKITPITNLDENEILGDLRTLCCKLAAILALKQVEWGLDKELMPLKMEQLKMIIKDARMVAKEGQLLKALRSTVQRVEQHIEGTRNLPKGIYS